MSAPILLPVRISRAHQNKDCEQRAGDLGGVVIVVERKSNGAEEGRQTGCDKVGPAKAGKVQADLNLETSKEVDNDGVDDQLHEEDWKVDDVLGDD